VKYHEESWQGAEVFSMPGDFDALVNKVMRRMNEASGPYQVSNSPAAPMCQAHFMC